MRHIGIAVVLLGALIGCSQPAQSAEMKDLLSGEKYALTLQMKDLDGEWRRLSTGGGGTGGLAAVYSAMFGGAGNVYYTKGEMVSVATETYLIAYTLRTDPMGYMAVMRGGPGSAPAEELTAESALCLSLLNLRATGSLTDIRQFNLEEEIAAQAKMAAATADMVSGGGEPTGSSPESLSNLKNLALAVQMFLADSEDDVMPDMTDMVAVMDVLGEYVKNDEVFFRPDTGQAYAVNSSLSQKRLAEVADPTNVAVFYEEEAGEGGTRGVAFLDGHAARVGSGQWEDVKAASGIE